MSAGVCLSVRPSIRLSLAMAVLNCAWEHECLQTVLTLNDIEYKLKCHRCRLNNLISYTDACIYLFNL